MPIYEYKCSKCGRTFDARQSFSDAPLTTCKLCGETGGLEKLISSPSFQFKGSGWYVTDYGGSKTASGAPSSATAGDSKPASTESAPAAEPKAPATDTKKD